MKTFRLDVHGVTCDGCADAVRRVICELDGVGHVDVALDPGESALRSGIATVQTDPRRVTQGHILAAINGLGHFAELCADGHVEQDVA